VSDAVAADPEAASVAEPKGTFPAAKSTLPVGAAAPLAGFTVTLNTVEALCAMPAGLAVTETVVLTSGAVRVTVIDVDADAVKFPAPV
jgi:hypothetical protein